MEAFSAVSPQLAAADKTNCHTSKIKGVAPYFCYHFANVTEAPVVSAVKNKMGLNKSEATTASKFLDYSGYSTPFPQYARNGKGNRMVFGTKKTFHDDKGFCWGEPDGEDVKPAKYSALQGHFLFPLTGYPHLQISGNLVVMQPDESLHSPRPAAEVTTVYWMLVHSPAGDNINYKILDHGNITVENDAATAGKNVVVHSVVPKFTEGHVGLWMWNEYDKATFSAGVGDGSIRKISDMLTYKFSKSGDVRQYLGAGPMSARVVAKKV